MILILIPLAYVIGSIPVGYLLAKHFYGIDIRQHGSGNPGATNVWRVLGRQPGIITLALDILKGAVPVLLCRLVVPNELGTAVYSGMAAIAGHNWILFLRGSGGKGVATSAGVFLCLMPIQSLIAIGTFLIVFRVTRHVSSGSMAGAVTLVLMTFVIRTPIFFRLVAFIASIMILVKHVPNMKRLAIGEEPKVNF